MQEVTEKDFDGIVESGVAVMHFYAPWCKPCKEVAVDVKALEREFDHVDFGKINVDKQPGLASRFAVVEIPAVLIFKEGDEIERLDGIVPLPVLRNEIASRITRHASDEVLLGENRYQ
tara:strand:+ start:996 stop:1349 length:354 start_codon:yes stop_codon:yes gene_type:complete